MSKYRGDSPAKVVARSWAYDQIPEKDLFSKNHIIIASEHGGDIDELQGRGVRNERILACDLNHNAVILAYARGVDAVYCSIQQRVRDTLLDRVPATLSSVNIDLCNILPTSVEVLNECLRLLHKAHWDGIVMLTFAVGYKDDLACNGVLCSECKNGPCDTKRLDYLNDNVYRTNKKARCETNQHLPFRKSNLYRYQSNTAVCDGSPMGLVVMRVSNGNIVCINKPTT
jgi:hypothetical protein